MTRSFRHRNQISSTIPDHIHLLQILTIRYYIPNNRLNGTNLSELWSNYWCTKERDGPNLEISFPALHGSIPYQSKKQ